MRWAEGRTFGLVFDGGPEVRQVAEEAAKLFLHENALNTAAFPSLGEIQTELNRLTKEGRWDATTAWTPTRPRISQVR